MSAYKDLEKRKEYQREWARKKTISPKVESSPEATYCLLFSKLRKIREEHNLSNFSYWMMDIRSMNKDFMCRYGRYENRPIVEIVKPIVKRLILRIVEIAEPIVEIAEPIVEIVKIAEPIVEIVDIIVASHFNCEECEFKMKRTEHNKNHTKCIDCFYPNCVRGKCFIILD
jgi:hypothetical protein